jgi:hypothetical protein
VSERQILITYSCDGWDEEDRDWLYERIHSVLSGLLINEDFTMEEVAK